MEELAIGIGLFINVIFTEIVGITAGGMVVPGYIALHLDMPFQIISTILISFLTFSSIRYLSRFIIIYGRRQLMFSILLGFLMARFFNHIVGSGILLGSDFTLKAIGMIIPGLLAYWMERQGVVESVCGLLVGSILTRMILIIIVGSNI